MADPNTDPSTSGATVTEHSTEEQQARPAPRSARADAHAVSAAATAVEVENQAAHAARTEARRLRDTLEILDFALSQCPDMSCFDPNNALHALDGTVDPDRARAFIRSVLDQRADPYQAVEGLHRSRLREKVTGAAMEVAQNLHDIADGRVAHAPKAAQGPAIPPHGEGGQPKEQLPQRHPKQGEQAADSEAAAESTLATIERIEAAVGVDVPGNVLALVQRGVPHPDGMDGEAAAAAVTSLMPQAAQADAGEPAEPRPFSQAASAAPRNGRAAAPQTAKAASS